MGKHVKPPQRVAAPTITYCMECLHRKTAKGHYGYISRDEQNLSYCYACRNKRVLCLKRNHNGKCKWYQGIGQAPYVTPGDYAQRGKGEKHEHYGNHKQAYKP